MRNVFVMIVLLFSVVDVLACRPPRWDRMSWGNMQAVAENLDVRRKLGREPVTSLRILEGSKYLVESENCSVEVVVEMEISDSRGPCGRSRKFVVKSVEDAVCGH